MVIKVAKQFTRSNDTICFLTYQVGKTLDLFQPNYRLRFKHTFVSAEWIHHYIKIRSMICTSMQGFKTLDLFWRMFTTKNQIQESRLIFFYLRSEQWNAQKEVNPLFLKHGLLLPILFKTSVLKNVFFVQTMNPTSTTANRGIQM